MGLLVQTGATVVPWTISRSPVDSAEVIGDSYGGGGGGAGTGIGGMSGRGFGRGLSGQDGNGGNGGNGGGASGTSPNGNGVGGQGGLFTEVQYNNGTQQYNIAGGGGGGITTNSSGSNYGNGGGIHGYGIIICIKWICMYGCGGGGGFVQKVSHVFSELLPPGKGGNGVIYIYIFINVT